MGLVNDGQRWEGPTEFYVEWRHVIMGRRLGDQAGTTGEHSESEAKSTLSGDFMEPLKMERYGPPRHKRSRRRAQLWDMKISSKERASKRDKLGLHQ